MINSPRSVNTIRVLGLLSAIVSAAISFLNGDAATAGGLLGAAVSAAGMKRD